MKTEQKIKLSELKLNDGSHGLPKNPRFIKDERFKKLCESVRDFPEAMPARGIVVDERGVILGGNMRYRSCQELGMKEIPASWVHRLTGLSVEQKRRFIIMDNRPYGDDDFDLLGNEWDVDDLIKLGFSEKELGMGTDTPTLAEQIAAESEYSEQYNAAEKRAEKIQKRIEQIKKQQPGLLNSAKAIVLSADTNDALIIADENLADFLSELRRYVEQGIESPLASILNVVHHL